MHKENRIKYLIYKVVFSLILHTLLEKKIQKKKINLSTTYSISQGHMSGNAIHFFMPYVLLHVRFLKQ